MARAIPKAALVKHRLERAAEGRGAGEVALDFAEHGEGAEGDDRGRRAGAHHVWRERMRSPLM
jgi:hypothetical protein